MVVKKLCSKINLPNTIKICILGENVKIIINETEGVAKISKKENDWNWELLEFRKPLQSELTHLIVKDILGNGDCGLTKYDESCRLHKLLLYAFIKHLELVEGRRFTYCPIA